MEKTISILNNFFAIGFRAKIVLAGYRKSYTRNPEMFSYLTFDLYFKVKPMLNLDQKCL
jgi:hypothetical protein